jgi:predicted ArsR family transcriptional regulator
MSHERAIFELMTRSVSVWQVAKQLRISVNHARKLLDAMAARQQVRALGKGWYEPVERRS